MQKETAETARITPNALHMDRNCSRVIMGLFSIAHIEVKNIVDDIVSCSACELCISPEEG